MLLFDICPLVAAKVRFATRKSEKVHHQGKSIWLVKRTLPYALILCNVYKNKRMQKGKRHWETGEKTLGNREKAIGLLVVAARPHL